MKLEVWRSFCFMNWSNSSIINRSVLSSQDLLASSIALTGGKDLLRGAFGDRFDLDAAMVWLETETLNNFRNFPTLEIVSASEINYARGAYSTDTETIYLAREFVTQNADNEQAIAEVILEEY